MLAVVMPPARAHEARVAHVDGVEYAHVGLYGRGAVGARAAAYVAVRVDEAWHDYFARHVDDARVRRHARRRARAGGDNLSVADYEHAVVDGSPVGVDDGRARVRDGELGLSARRGGRAREREER